MEAPGPGSTIVSPETSWSPQPKREYLLLSRRLSRSFPYDSLVLPVLLTYSAMQYLLAAASFQRGVAGQIAATAPREGVEARGPWDITAARHEQARRTE